MMMNPDVRDRLRTVDERGRRLWVYADIFSGAWRNKRRWVAWFLILFYVFLPWLRWQGLPLVQLDIVHRRFIIWGNVFWPHELGTFIPLVLGIGFFIFAVSSYAGRVWCGWTCPQTVYLEFVFRPIEQWIEGKPRAQKILNELPFFHSDRIGKKIFKWVVFFLISFLIANNFLAYFIGSGKLLEVMTHPPYENPFLFMLMLFIIGAFMFNFTWFREQTCTIVCPYGRLQSVLLDKKSWLVGYDAKRGEPRGKGKGGDCVDCFKCVQVCPTGIDIRDGTQLECVNCTACIDACNFVMSKINKPLNLIGYTSQEKIEGVESGKNRIRPLIYAVLTVGLFTLAFANVQTRLPFNVTALRASATDFTVTADKVQNHVRLKIDNESVSDLKVHVQALDNETELIIPQNDSVIPPSQSVVLEIFAQSPRESFKNGLLVKPIRVSTSPTDTKDIKLSLFGVGK